MCSYAVCASEFDAVSDQRIKTNIQNLESSIDIITQLRPVTFNYKNKNKYGTNLRYGLIAQEVRKILPSIVNISYGQIDNINTEFNKNDIQKDNDKITLQLDNLDIQKDDKLEICDIDDKGITSNIRTVDILDISNNEFSFIALKVDTSKNYVYLVNMLMTFMQLIIWL